MILKTSILGLMEHLKLRAPRSQAQQSCSKWTSEPV